MPAVEDEEDPPDAAAELFVGVWVALAIPVFRVESVEFEVHGHAYCPTEPLSTWWAYLAAHSCWTVVVGF